MPAAAGAPGDGGALAVVEELARRFGAGDLDGAFELYDPGVRIEQPSSLPHGGTHLGREGIEAMGRRFGATWERTIADPRRHGAGGGLVVQVTTQTWTARATGRSATVDVVELLRVEGDRVVEIRVFPQDTHRLLATLDGDSADGS